MRRGERLDPAGKGLCERLRRVAQRLAGDRLDHRHGVLDPVCELPRQQLLLLFPLLAVSDVAALGDDVDDTPRLVSHAGHGKLCLTPRAVGKRKSDFARDGLAAGQGAFESGLPPTFLRQAAPPGRVPQEPADDRLL
jgi:hypothetical protein